MAISVFSVRLFFQTINRDKIEFRRKNLWLNRWRCRRMSFASCPREKDCRHRWLRAAFGELHFNAVKTFAMYAELFLVHARKIRLLIWWILFWVCWFSFKFFKNIFVCRYTCLKWVGWNPLTPIFCFRVNHISPVQWAID